MENDERKYKSVFISAGTKFRNKKKFRYGIPAYTGPFRALGIRDYERVCYCVRDASLSKDHVVLLGQ
jgi:hypothetical protein